MKFTDPHAFRDLPSKAVTLLGMSGAGKTMLANRLPRAEWFHYSVDYRIGTKYMDEPILDDIKLRMMRDPYVADLLRTDSIYVRSNISITNLKPLSMFIGKIGDPARGGLSLEEYLRRQRLHRRAEINALLDVEEFIHKARDIYGYAHFINDAGGSVCEVVDLDDPSDPVMAALDRATVAIYIRGDDRFVEELIARQRAHPKPMYFPEDFLREVLGAYMAARGFARDGDIDPDDFAIHAFELLARRRAPRYQAMADRLGYTVSMDEAAAVTSGAALDDLVCDLIRRDAA